MLFILNGINQIMGRTFVSRFVTGLWNPFQCYTPICRKLAVFILLGTEVGSQASKTNQ
ncbi:hypothetical protein BV95_01295 [Sphingobium chlorophenolicum]|uniref:Uncharacterized protein n=1 Tax=Sphingobium chlorophenolicum TaxID=46429 RepID=A0A081RH14_SPHCR|nr:hypothetical protein BV95_01295 [Sphingobium chlorophenolicum]